MTIIEQRTMDAVSAACHKYSNDKETLRDKFAMAAISNPRFFDMVCSRCGCYDAGLVAEYAYHLADGMMEVRKKSGD